MSKSDSSSEAPSRRFVTPDNPWADRVRFSRRAGGYAYHPGRASCHADEVEAVIAALEGLGAYTGDPIELGDGWFVVEFDEGVAGPADAVIEGLRARGHRVEPDYVLFANPMFANPMFANPMFANPMFANPMFANPMFANPMFANPMFANQASGSFSNPVYAGTVYASPVYANPVFSNPAMASGYICGGERPSTARPSAPPDRAPPDYHPVSGRRAVILDSGIAGVGCPPPLDALSNAYQLDHEQPDAAGNNFLDPAAGHGTFIAGLIQALSPGHEIVPLRVVSPYGDVTVSNVVMAIDWLAKSDLLGPDTVVNMSFGGYADEDMRVLSAAVRRVIRTNAVVVASAGNDATDRPLFPACLPDVVGVAALGQYGPAPFSNYGRWVDACAPGTDLVGMFFEFNGAMELPPMPGGVDPDHFEHWARWTGTSFAAPVVTAALLRHMTLSAVDAGRAVSDVVDAPALFRLPGLGTIVNLAPNDVDCEAFGRTIPGPVGNKV